MLLDILAFISVVVAPVLILIEIDERRLERHIRQAMKVGNP